MEEGREPSISEERESQEKGTANTKAYPWPDGPASRKPVWMEDTEQGEVVATRRGYWRLMECVSSPESEVRSH